MTKNKCDDGINIRQRHHCGDVADSHDNQEDELNGNDIQGDDSMISSKTSLRDAQERGPCARFRKACSLHKGLLLALLSCIFQASGAIGVKLLYGRIPPTEIAAVRLISYSLFAAVLSLYYKISPRVTLKQLPWLLLRITCGTIAMCLAFYAYQNIPVGDANAIIFISPVLTGFCAWILLGEKFTLVDVGLAVFALVGVVLIARPSFLFGKFVEASGERNTVLGVVAALLAALFASLVFVLIRKLGGISLHPLTQIFYFGLFGFIMTTVLTAVLGLLIVPRCGMDRLVLIFIAVIGFLAQISMTYAFKLEKAAYVAVVKSNNVILAFLLEFAIFGTVPFWLSLIGAALVMASSLGVTAKKWKASHSKKETDNTSDRDDDIDLENEEEMEVNVRQS
ncbi:solute carrier family 35 member G1-like [Lytechinus variegatus]|uniref:solute carrier family 35 member G1-like n=1 Tax=Lytechinus variegatus TaxID=7654 RepID=UPI001BB1835E|nr:solute carrier family 35 member G1-like [Lytechinus variegatus]